jgi:hypothetical protein
MDCISKVSGTRIKASIRSYDPSIKTGMTVCPIIIPMYKTGLGIPEISEKTGIPKSTIRNNLVKSIPLRSLKEAVAVSVKAGRHKGFEKGTKPVQSEETRKKMSLAKKGKGKGYSLKPSGYLAFTMGENKDRSLHVVIMEQHIGRKLKKDEVVHHINEIKTDNRIENLQLMTNKEHSRLHARLNQARGVSYDISKETRRGERHLKSKLKESDVIEIFNSSKSGAELADIYGVQKACINRIKRGESWKHLNLKNKENG